MLLDQDCCPPSASRAEQKACKTAVFSSIGSARRGLKGLHATAAYHPANTTSDRNGACSSVLGHRRANIRDAMADQPFAPTSSHRKASALGCQSPGSLCGRAIGIEGARGHERRLVLTAPHGLPGELQLPGYRDGGTGSTSCRIRKRSFLGFCGRVGAHQSAT